MASTFMWPNVPHTRPSLSGFVARPEPERADLLRRLKELGGRAKVCPLRLAELHLLKQQLNAALAAEDVAINAYERKLDKLSTRFKNVGNFGVTHTVTPSVELEFPAAPRGGLSKSKIKRKRRPQRK
jgi:hypothetical protein